ncbi:hypothetical protein BJF85_13695 [Saccharomonospora sp. CUA-673]|nr:hypothetical protein BJF85_13695 [Saccharomonospora sp. CUA-673]
MRSAFASSARRAASVRASSRVFSEYASAADRVAAASSSAFLRSSSISSSASFIIVLTRSLIAAGPVGSSAIRVRAALVSTSSCCACPSAFVRSATDAVASSRLRAVRSSRSLNFFRCSSTCTWS